MTIHITLITYDAPHRKTQDVLSTMLMRDRFTINIAIVPLVERKQRNILFKHRPDQFLGPSIREIAEKYRLAIHDFTNWRELQARTEFFVVCGANLLEPEFCDNNKIVNCHPGLIPMTRGLDSFKWAIFNGDQIGNTLHFIDSGVDLGTTVHHQITDIFESDSLDSLAERHYRNELYLLSHFDEYLERGTVLDLPVREPTKRMPQQIEVEMVSRFDSYKAKCLLFKADNLSQTNAALPPSA